MGTTCCCLGTASVYFHSPQCGPVFLLCFQCCVSNVMFHETSVLREERGRCVAYNCVKAALRVECVVWYGRNCLRSFGPQLGARHTYIFCPVSQAISSPNVTVNAYRDTAPCLGLQIYAVEEEAAICLLVMCYKLGSYFTPAGVCSSHPEGSSWDAVLEMDLWKKNNWKARHWSCFLTPALNSG